MEADTKKAMADAAYAIQKEEQRKTIEITTANADIAKQEREIELKQKQVAVRERALEAEVKKQAEAEKYAAQQKADAALYQRQKEAEAQKYEREQEALAEKTSAEARRFAKEQEAAGIAAVGKAEAEAIQAKYGEDKVKLATYPDNFTEELETTIQTIVNMSDDPLMKAIIVNQSVPGTAEAFTQIKERRPDILCIAGEAHEDLPVVGASADLVCNTTSSPAAT